MTFTTDNALATSLAADPFTTLAVHYGMLLGVGDFEVLAANPRGKLRLHQAWQHGPGVIWGYEPTVVADSTILQVSPGLAVDGVGREVASSSDHCLDVAQWLAEHEDDVDTTVNGDETSFDAELWLRHRACLARPVPAMSSTCEGSNRDTEFSRILETAELELRPGLSADPRSDSFAALRALVRDGDTGSAVATDWLQAFRAVAAAETIGLEPPAFAGTSPTASRLFPENDPGELCLARLPGLKLTGTGAAARLEAPEIDISARRSHVPTWVIEELLAELLTGHVDAPAVDTGGPRIQSVVRAGTTVTIALTTEVVEGTIPEALELATLDRSGGPGTAAWVAVPLAPGDVDYQAGPPTTIAFDLPSAPSADVTHRLVVRGSGPAPLVGLVGDTPIPLAGREGGPAGSAAEGRDVAEVFVP